MTAGIPNAVSGAGPLAIVCGGGSLPIAVAEAAQRQGRRVVLLAIRGAADAPRISAFPHHWISPGQVGRNLRLLRAEGCRDLVFIGNVTRPTLGQAARIDLFTLRQLPRLIRVFRQGDDGLLSGLGSILEEHGFRLLGAHEVAPDLLMPLGTIGARKPVDGAWADIRRALALLQATGPFDVGQAAVVSDNRVLAIEAAEGTDHMLAQLAELRRSGKIHARDKSGVLVKAPKPRQDRRFDLPSIGPRTVEGVAAAGLAGIAVVAGSTMVAEPERLVTAADRAGVFVVGVTADGTAP
jgi:DUF1009 family protein